ncbi:protein-L-isoaspartate(D-aspartate) O-methyltransferase [Thiohalobacter sp. IOR34]|uniref:protein-L-isoaspartate(D-aspartate) O-methyltransferase n=1 Tax=Thiohalobacter sp. IOR34 TaxID=3057176 RepID=UPI0025AFF10B|nr:protein-L-isoaspartate(D-aspartate) O-methyltransferase [Thiohalobacter sp. IOR34]WJW76607.1 protein-L-isoaspartate(D-aspartate) O-methyltransferase [Thiohalobacter sp. IOR34]
MHTRISGIGMTSQRTRDRLVQRLRAKGIVNEALLEVMGRMPRHLFVDEALASRAYEDTALPIGFGQTISQPYIVARMTEELLRGEPRRVLEVGTGSGYQAAVLSQLVEKVFTVERIDALARRVRQRFRQMGFRNIQLKHSDGSWGWPSKAPFDAILVTAAPPEIPTGLLEQLADGGRMVIPVGGRNGQTLAVITRRGAVCEREDLEAVSFVPLLGGAG